MASISELGQRVKAKYPGSYDDMDDASVGRAVQAKFPGQYDDFTDGPQMIASHIPGAALPQQPAPGRGESGIRGALQGASFGFGDEAAAAIDAALPRFLHNEVSREAVGSGETYGDRYRSARDYYRDRNAAAEEANPGTYLATLVTGAMAPTVLGGAPLTGARGLTVAAGQGALSGAGYSQADEGLGLARDISLGGALGAAGHGAGAALGAAAKRLTGAAGRRLLSSHGRAAGQAGQESAEALASSAGKLGAETRHGGRYIESLLDKESKGLLTAAQVAEIASLRASGELPALAQSVAQNTLDALPGQLNTIAARRAELAALQQAAPQAVASRTKELLKPSVKQDAKSFLKSYAEPLIWAGAADQVGGAMGLSDADRLRMAGVAGLVGGRTRAGKALMARLKKPGNQAAIARLQERTAEKLTRLRRPLAVGVPASLIAALEEEETP
jgi:hypothetical protein